MSRATDALPLLPTSNDDAVAIIGLACRFPGAPDPLRFWELLRAGEDAVAEPSAARRVSLEWGGQALGAGPRRAGYLPDIAGFEPLFFGLSPAEARQLDPQQRLLLELSWELFEDAGRDPWAQAGSRTGVFVGAMWSEYAELGRGRRPSPHTGLGGEASVLAARLAHCWDLRGPASTVLSASSSSLLAVHQACQSLRCGEVDAAVAGGVNLIVSPRSTAIMRAAKTQSASGRCRPFDARADGYTRGEGAGLVLLVRLRDALAAGEPIYCVIEGSAANSDGRTESLLQPSLEAQAQLLRSACASAGVEPRRVAYVEAHGTGTALGDRTELGALGAVHGAGRDPEAPLLVGSVKSNLGHLEAAAGVAGLIKAALAVAARELPATLHCERPSEALGAELALPRARTPWPAQAESYAGVSSFGWGGTNVHVVLGAAPELEARPREEFGGPLVFPLSASSAQALAARARDIAALVDTPEAPSLVDLCHTLGSRRSHHGHRLAVVAASRSELRERLSSRAAQGEASVAASPSAGPVFVFGGSGGSLAALRALGDPSLERALPAFAASWRRCEASLRPYFEGASLPERLAGELGELPPSITQPAVFALQVALAAQWRAWGVEPGAVIGHSFGEVAAAHVAGALDLDDAARVIATRGRLIDGVTGQGATAVIGLDGERAEAALESFGGAVTIAGYNDPRTTLVSGEAAAVEALLARLDAQSVFARRVAMPFAGHSPLMDPLLAPLEAALAGVGSRAEASRVPMFSTALGRWLGVGETLGPDYWVRNLRDPVRFCPGIVAAIEGGHDSFLELGPGAVLRASVVASARGQGKATRALASIGQVLGEGGLPFALASTLARLYEQGHTPDFGAVAPAGRLCRLPAHRWTRTPHWLPTEDSASASESPATPRPTSSTVRAKRDPGARLRALVAELLGLGSASELDERRALRDYGMDSLLRMELRARLMAELDVELPVSFAVDHPTLAAMAEALAQMSTPKPAKREPKVAAKREPKVAAKREPKVAAKREPKVAAKREPKVAAKPKRTLARSPSDDAIAVVGVSCRLPGANDREAYWRLLRSGRDAIGPVPSERWSVDEWYDADPHAEHQMYMREGGFLDQDVRGFDADFFDISAREARGLDPQQRLLLEVGWEALEDAGVRPSSLRGSDTGVFVGISTHEYGQRHIDSGSPANLDAYSLTGSSMSVASGRLAFVLGLEGPVMSVDTACSSGLSALHLACQSLRAGECDLALAGAADLLLSPVYAMYWCRVGMLSRSNRSRSFDARADGFGKGEGCVVLALTRLEDALRRGDRVRAVIRGSAVVHDGRSGGLTVPNGRAQERALTRALRDADMGPAELSYIEGHGTGGAVADAIEVEALGAVIGPALPEDAGPIPLGSAKANLGHLGASGGLAGVLKVICALEHGELPPQANFSEPSPHIPWARLPFEVLRAPRAWDAQGGTRAASVSSIGLGGTTATIIVEQAPEVAVTPAREAEAAGLRAFPVSARSPEALRALAGRIAALPELMGEAGPGLEPLVHAATHRRDHLAHRAVVLADSRARLREGLGALAAGRAHPQVVEGQAEGAPKLVFTFTGVGSQWPSMGLDLYACEPVFRGALDACAEAFARHGFPDLLRELEAPGGRPRLDSIEVAQPTIFSVEVALVALWRSWGVEPDVVVGHSMGEFAAAHTAGALDLDQAAAVLVERGRLLASVAGQGTMAVVGLSAEATREALGDIPRTRLCVATCNGPATTVIAGVEVEVDAFLAKLEAQGVFCRKLDVQGAYHSPQMNPLYDELVATMPDLRPSALRVPMISTLQGGWIEGASLDARYWASNMRDEVRFAQAMAELMAEGRAVFVEIGPNPDLRWALNECREASGNPGVTILPSMLREREARPTLVASLAKLHVLGVRVDLEAFAPAAPSSAPVDLPHYPWQRRRHWLEDPRGPVDAGRRLEEKEERHVEALTVVAKASEPLGARWRAAAVDERESVLRAGLRAIAAEELAVEPGVHFAADTTFAELGMDSFMAMSLASRLSRALELSLGSTLVYECPDLDSLCAYLGERLGDASTPEPASPEEAEVRPAPAVIRSGPAGDEPIAIVGAACRLPGGVVDLPSLWALLREGRDAVTEIPASRFDLDAHYDPELSRPGSMYSRTAGLLDDVASFDADFFAVTPREARSMDPQHRIALELAWEALEHAGIPVGELQGAGGRGSMGVFLGICSSDYSRRHVDSGAPERVDAYSRTGIAYSVAAGRIAHALGVRGPTLAIDTACASSLVAMHYAAMSLRAGECELALAGGVSVLLKPEVFASLCRLGVLSRSGRVRAFSAEADGYVRAEGCGMVVLEPLSVAERRGDRILGLIRGSAVGHNGRSNGLTAPSAAAQVEVIEAAMRRAGVGAEAIDYLEAHGTGTRLGDAIEMRALNSVFGGRSRALPVGSVKGNLGHLEASAGVASVLKVLCALDAGELPRQLHFERPSAHIDWSGPVEVVDAARPWPASATRLAGVSSLGANGTNAHLVLEGPPRVESRRAAGSGADPKQTHLLTLSARSPEALRALASTHAADLRGILDAREVADRCFTAGARREHHRHRLAVVGARERLVEALESFVRGEATPELVVGEARRPSRGPRLSGPLRTLAARYVEGAAVDFAALHPEGRGRVVDLPRYPWQRRRYWLDRVEPARVEVGLGRGDGGEHPLVRGRAQLGLSPRMWAWELDIDEAREPMLGEHRFRGAAVVTGAVHLELALAAARAQLEAGASWRFEDVAIERALLVPEGVQKAARLLLVESGDGRGLGFQVLELGAEGGEGHLLARGRIVVGEALEPGPSSEPCVRSLEPEAFYAELAARGLAVEGSFARARRIELGDASLRAELDLPPALSASRSGYAIHPAFLDGCSTAMLALLPRDAHYLGVGFESLRVDAAALAAGFPERSVLELRLRGDVEGGRHRADAWLSDGQGRPLLELRGLGFQALARVERVASSSTPALSPSAASIEARVGRIVAEVAGFAPGRRWPEDRAISELGLDSIMVLEVLAELEQAFGVAVRDERPSLRSLSAGVRRALGS